MAWYNTVAARALGQKAIRARGARAVYKKIKKGWIRRISKDLLISPSGVILISLAFLIEMLDLIPLPGIDQIIELPLEVFFLFLLAKTANYPLKTMIIPFIIERIPVINDILPTWLFLMLI